MPGAAELLTEVYPISDTFFTEQTIFMNPQKPKRSVTKPEDIQTKHHWAYRRVFPQTERSVWIYN